MKSKKYTLFLLILLLSAPLMGGIALKDGRWSDERYLPTLSVQEHYDLGSTSLLDKDYETALTHFQVIVYHFFDSPFYADSIFYAGECSYYLHEYDMADKRFSYYLALPGQTRHFTKVFDYKYLIAEAYRKGARRHLLGRKRLPKIVRGREASIGLYEEVIVAMAGQEVAAKALYGKAKVLRKKREFKESVECLKTLTRRFPKTPLARQGYLLISKIYLQQGELEAQNPDYLQLAQVNLEKMKISFPTDETVAEIENNYFQMQEIHATSLYNTGRYYERRKKLHAATIYYMDAINRYPETTCAADCQTRLGAISDYFAQNAYNNS